MTSLNLVGTAWQHVVHTVYLLADAHQYNIAYNGKPNAHLPITAQVIRNTKELQPALILDTVLHDQ